MLKRLTILPGMKLLTSIDRELGGRLFIVGGAVRDAVLGRSIRDVDIVVFGDAKQSARAFSRRGSFPFVRLDESRGMYRVVSGPDFAIDFVPCQGNSLEEDLLKRDFTINAMACAVSRLREETDTNPLDANIGAVIDPCGGLEDCRQRTIRTVSKVTFEDDPLRMVRACRFMAELDFFMNPDVPTEISSYRQRLGTVARERILHELSILLDTPAFIAALSVMEETGLLDVIFENIGIVLSNHYDKKSLSISAIPAQVHGLISWLERQNSAIEQFLVERFDRKIDGGISLRALLRLACLMPVFDTVRALEKVGQKLTMSRAAIRSLRAWWFACRDGEQRFRDFQTSGSEQRSYLFEHGEDGLWGMLILAARRKTTPQDHQERYSMEQFLIRLCDMIRQPDTVRDELIHMINGRYIQSLTGLLPGPRLGGILRGIQHDIYVGKLQNETEVRHRLTSGVDSSPREM